MLDAMPPSPLPDRTASSGSSAAECRTGRLEEQAIENMKNGVSVIGDLFGQFEVEKISDRFAFN